MNSHGVPTTLSPAERQRAESIERLAEDAAANVPALLEELADPSWSVRRVVVAALANLGDAAAEPLCELLRIRRDSEARIAAAVDALAASTGARVDDAVLALADSPDPAIVADAVQILGRRRSAAAIPTLARLTQHDDDNVAVASIEALGRIGGRAAVDPLVAAIGSGNFFRTFPAIDVLGRGGDPRAVDPLAALLDDPRYAHEAARALGRTGESRAVAPLTNLITRPGDGIVRLSATSLAELYDRYAERYGITIALDHALRASSPPAAVRRLAHALAGADATEQTAICRVLGALGDSGAAPFLTGLLDASSPVATAAAAALKKLGREADAQLLEALQEGDSARRRVLLPLVSARSTSTPEVLYCLNDLDPTVRCMACETLARIGNTSAVPSLFALLSDPNPRIVQAAVSAIQALGSDETEALTLTAARSADTQVRRAAFRIIGYFGYASALDLLIKAINSGDERLRDSAIYGLPFIEDPRAREALFAAARHDDTRTRAAAMRALGQTSGEPEVIEVLGSGLSDADAWVRYYACQSLGKLRCEPLADAIAALLDDGAGQVRVAAVEALSHLQSDIALDVLRRMADSTDADMQRAALVGLGLGKHPSSLSILLAAANSPDPATRLVAVSALAGFDAPDVVPALARAAADKDDSVRTASVGILAGLSSIQATRALIELLRAGDPDARILAALASPSQGRIAGILSALTSADDEMSPRLTSALARMHSPEATGALLEALLLSNPPARKAAAATLGAIGTPECVEALKHASAEDPDPEVRRICALALAQ